MPFYEPATQPQGRLLAVETAQGGSAPVARDAGPRIAALLGRKLKMLARKEALRRVTPSPLAEEAKPPRLFRPDADWGEDA